MQKGLLIVISGASGTGKGTVCKKILADLPEVAYSISATTRTPRPGEVDGKEYYFLSRDEFKAWIAEEKFLEYAEVYGNFYGTPLNKIEERLNRGEDILLEIDVQGALNVKKKCPDGIYIFLLPPSLEELKRRIEGRGTETAESLARRLKNAVAEIEIGREYNYVVVNDTIENAVAQIKSIIAAERCKVERNPDKFQLGTRNKELGTSF
ncbi:MAG: guanylate kinase [Selenomonadaceae bacterium]|nr:guanylate kinase [Selenomonadaceae bacterium]